MAAMLARFWVSRFALVFLLLGAALAAVEFIGRGADASYWSVGVWSGIAAGIAASVSTYWSWRRTCALPGRAMLNPSTARTATSAPYATREPTSSS